jgi:hypothetical protein
VLGPEVLRAREIILGIKRDASNNLTDCVPKARMSDGLWRRVTSDPSKIYYSDGFVGIGTSMPNSPLDVRFDVSANHWLSVRNLAGGSSSAGLAAYSNSGVGYVYRTGAAYMSGPGGLESRLIVQDDAAISFYVNSGTRAHIASDGNVGIGTTAPAMKLDVNGPIKIGPQAGNPAACTAAQVGSMRYNPTTDSVQFCKANGGTPIWANAGGGYSGPMYSCACSGAISGTVFSPSDNTGQVCAYVYDSNYGGNATYQWSCSQIQ